MPPRRLPAAVVGVLALVVVAVVGAGTAGPLVLQGVEHRVAPVLPTATRPPEPRPTPPPVDLDAPPGGLSWLVTTVLIAGAVLVLVVVVLVVRRLLADRRPSPARGRSDGGGVADRPLDELATDVAPVMHDAVRRAAHRLREDLPPGDAVVAAWVALERAAAQTGVEREQAQTATELTVAVLDGTDADPAATRELLDLYLAARYSRHPVTAEHVVRARAALATIEAGLAGRTSS